jgi:hypothetical protein
MEDNASKYFDFGRDGDEKSEWKQGNGGDGDNFEFLTAVLNVYEPLDGLEYEVRNGAVETSWHVCVCVHLTDITQCDGKFVGSDYVTAHGLFGGHKAA